jgi:hypothetical protein
LRFGGRGEGVDHFQQARSYVLGFRAERRKCIVAIRVRAKVQLNLASVPRRRV